jgi:hypothetical protein
VDLPSKQDIAVKNDNSITDIAPQAIETYADKAPLDAVTDAEVSPTLEQLVVAEQLTQEQVTQEQAIQEQVIQEQVIQEQVIQPEVVAEQESETLAQQVDAEVPQVKEVVAQEEEDLSQTEAINKQVDEELTQAEAINAQADEDRILQNALDQAASSVALEAETSPDLSLTADYDRWLNAKLRESRDWLSQANRNSVSIQVFVRSKAAERELVYYLRNEWPLDLSKTYLYEVSTEDRSIYRVFYSEFDSLSLGKNQLKLFPESVKKNSPYLHSVYRMQKALL